MLEFVKLFQWKKVAIAFRSATRGLIYENTSSTRGILWKIPRPATLFPVNFAKFLRTSFLQNTCGQLLLLCPMALSDRELQPHYLKNICCWEIDCSKHYHLSKYFIKFPWTPSSTVKAIVTFKKNTNCKILKADGAIWAPPELISHNPLLF